MLCFHPGSPGIKPIDVACTHFDFFKPLRKDAQSVPFFWWPLNGQQQQKKFVLLGCQKGILKTFVLEAL